MHDTSNHDMTPGLGRAHHRGYWVVAALLTGSLCLGVFIAWRYRVSDHHLADAQARMAARGGELTAEGCVDEVIDWFSHCEAMAGLCEQSVARMMGRCLDAGDRRAFCESIEGGSADTGFGFHECETRHLSRDRTNACSSAYQAIFVHCDRIAAEEGGS